jgi:CheY-like chemotaxis protein
VPLGTSFNLLRSSGIPPSQPGLHDADLLRAYDSLLAKYAPPGFLVNARGELVHSFAGASQYLVPHDGRPSADILDNVARELKLALSGALQRGAKEQTAVSYTGIQVRTAHDGLRGVQLIEQKRPDVALVDIGLPGLDGYEVARRTRAVYGSDGIRLVALTGYGRAEDHAAVSAAGFDFHLVKPIDLGQLNEVLGTACARNREPLV